MKVTRLRIYDAWSFCKDCPCDVTFDERSTVIIGKNNSGKSNVLRGLRFITSRVRHDAALLLARNEVYDYGKDDIVARPAIELSLELNSGEIHDWAEQIAEDANGLNREAFQAALQRSLTIRLEHATTSKNSVQLRKQWMPFKEQPSDKPARKKQEEDAKKLMDWLQAHLNENITFLGGWRSLDSKVEGDKTIVKVLHDMQGADTNNPAHLRVFDKVEAFFLKLAGLRTGQLRLSANGTSLNVRYRDRYLPIQSFGDGVVHTLLMAFEFMRKQNHLFLVEEPETHLHPELIRMLVDEIGADQNNNQFIITTHSPVLLDSSQQTLTYCVEYNDDFSSIARCDTVPALRRVLDVLDARLSDLLQANCVIWVEGPTDRMFLNRCLSILAPHFTEGRHYQIAYYGGKLLAHYSADDSMASLLNVLNLNRHSAVIADSDVDNAGDVANDTKQRLKAEIEKSGGVFWITAGREIENYITERVLTCVYQSLLPSLGSARVSVGQFDRIEDVLAVLVPNPPRGDGWKIDYGANKARIMSLLVDAIHDADLNMYDIRDRMKQIVDFIAAANGLKN